MSENTDRIIDTHLKQRPAARHAYRHDPTLHLQVEVARRMLGVMELVMQREGVPYNIGERVLNEVMHAGLGDWEREALMTRDEARELLLTTFDPSASECTINQLFTEPGPSSNQPEQLTTEQVRGMWHDVMPVPDGPPRTQTETFGEDEPGSSA